MNRIINIPHKVCDYTCMWNGIEDLYCWKTGNHVPDYLFFGISAFCSCTYIKLKKPKDKRIVYWNNGLPVKMYDFMQDIIGYDYKISQNKTFEISLISIKKNIDNGIPVVLGALDMYHLTYHDKFYHKVHIPIHFVLLIGYDDSTQNVIVYDCAKQDHQMISYSDLKAAWDITIPRLSKPNTYYTFSFNKDINTLEHIFHRGLKKKCAQNLNSPVSFIGISGIRKIAKEFPKWKKELPYQSYIESLLHFIEYTGFPPSLPKEPINSSLNNSSNWTTYHKAARDKFASLLIWGNDQYNHPEWDQAANLFNQSGKIFENLTSLIFSYIINNTITLSDVPLMLIAIATLEEQAYSLIDKSIK